MGFNYTITIKGVDSFMEAVIYLEGAQQTLECVWVSNQYITRNTKYIPRI